MSRSFTSLVALAALVTLGACAAEEPTGIPLDELASRLAEVECRLLFECGEPFGDEVMSAYLQDEETCRREALRRAERSFAPEVQMVARGTMAYDPAMAEACLAEASEGCQARLWGTAPPSACDAMFRGTVREGETCWAKAECGAGTFCTGTRCDEPGVCAERLDVDEPCDGDGQCVEGAVCAYTGEVDERRCVDSSSEARVLADASEGGACGHVTATDTLDEYRACAAGLICVLTGSGVGTCQPAVPEGGACTSTFDCADRLFCNCGGSLTCPDDSGTCVSPTLVQTAGEACGAEAEDVRFCDEWNGLHCEAGECVSPGDGSEGSACTVDSDCESGFMCFDRECIQPRPAGAPCLEGDGRACESRTCVDGACAERFCDRW